ncbi:hypothetical protein WKR88_08525 [Trinickia caryophylli]|nr:hypothetical protein [Trinickia caryophylli]TRX14610.1 hypothetical protein FNF07_25510 [Trinickia caryophylli]WQE14452.1 hypothetical protein U0034_27700 [Trinickia caryophylli]
MPRVISPVSTLRSVSPPPGRPHVQPAPSHALPLHAPTPVHPPRPMSDNGDGYIPLLDGDAMPGVSGRQTRFSPRPIPSSHDGDWGDWHSRTSSPVFTEPPVSESSHSGWHDSQFQPDPTPGIPGMTGTGRPRPPGMNPANNPWTSQFRPWQNMMQGGFGIAAMIAETFINVVQSIAQIFQKWGESMVSLTRR